MTASQQSASLPPAARCTIVPPPSGGNDAVTIPRPPRLPGQGPVTDRSAPDFDSADWAEQAGGSRPGPPESGIVPIDCDDDDREERRDTLPSIYDNSGVPSTERAPVVRVVEPSNG